MSAALSPAASALDGECRKRAALTLLELRRAALVRRCRRALLGLLLERDTATADDVRRLVPMPPSINPKLVGAAVAGLADLDLMRQTGYVLSSRPEAHRRPVGIWTLADLDGALAWLAAHPDLPDPAEPSPGPLWDH
jgi:hypothetical protein